MKAKQIPDVLAASSSLRVIEIDPQTDPRWEALMNSIPARPIYHPAWLKVLEAVYGYKPVHLACEDATGQLVGILPLFYQRGWRTGCILRSVFTGPLTSDDQAIAALVQAAVERTRAGSGVQLHLKIMSNAIDDQVEGMIGVPVYETYLLALPERADLIRLDSAIKRAVNKATKSGVQVHEAQTERELRAWYELYLHTMRKFAALPYPYRYYKTAWRQLHSRGMVRVLLADHGEVGQRKLLGGIFLLQYGQTVSFVSAAWREEDQALRPNDVLHWRAIQDACTDGFRWYDFGDVELGNEGRARYKSKWGAKANMAYDYSYPAPDGERSSDQGLSRYRAQQLIQAAWQHLPINAVGLLSDWYYALHLY